MELINILALEDTIEDFELMEYVLRSAHLEFTIKRVDKRNEFISALQTEPFDIILSDHSLPQFNSIEALELCRASNLDVPFILVTGAVSEEFAVNILKKGADDYVLKSNLTRLPSAITNALKQKRLEVEKNEARKALSTQNEELIKINKELDSFVYSASHNLRAPLSSVLGLIHLAKLEDEKKGTTSNVYFDIIEKCIVNLDDTLKEIIEYSRNSRLNLATEKIDIRNLINDHLERMSYIPGSEKIDKHIYIYEESPFYSDRYRISVILNNILSNAIKYYDDTKDHPSLRITVTTNKKEARMEFADNGIGIDENYVNRVFEMFFRGTGGKEGTGLGLYIVQEAVQKLKGTISIKSKLREGTTFMINLPNRQQSSIDQKNAVRYT
ncbi:MAG TPA: ATP-binding protein [Cyclobacteriaceae bacterium]|nr:ATP-binding protein [Cyclobacteriaceae bacterium]